MEIGNMVFLKGRDVVNEKKVTFKFYDIRDSLRLRRVTTLTSRIIGRDLGT